MSTSGRYLRLAKAEECGSLSALALRSKAYWGYDPVFIQACREELTVKPENARAGRVVVLVEEDTLLGFYALDQGERRDEAEVSLLFVEPAVIGRGIGRVLWDEFFSNRDWTVASAVAIVMLVAVVGPILLLGRWAERAS